MEHNERLYHLLQFLNFIKTLKYQDCSLHFLEGKKYVIQEFYLKDFMQFIGVSPTKQNQRTKLIDYFERLHKADPIVKQFTDGSFRIFATFLYSGINKVANRWVGKVYIIEESV